MQSPTVPTDNNILAVIANRTLSMNPALRRIGEYILAHPEDCKVMAIRDLAQAAGVADSTVTRFVKELPLSGFQELKIKIAEALSLQGSAAPQEGGDPYIFDNMDPEDSAAVMADKLCHQFVDLLWQCRRMADLHTVDACALLVDKAHTVTICCSGSSLLAAEEMRMRLTRSGKKCIVTCDPVYQAMWAATCDPGDLFIGLSNSGRTTSIVESLAQAKARGAATVAVTAFPNSPLAKQGGQVLLTPVCAREVQDAYSWDPGSSKMAQLYFMDLLYCRFAALHREDSLKNLEATYEALKNMRSR